MLNKSFIETVSNYIKKNKLLCKSGKYIVALSGGADSVTLALTLSQLGYTIEAAHCNFHLRGKESDRDEIFCKEFCSQNNIPFHLLHFDTVSFAQLHKISIEMAARQLRYAYFEQLMKDIDATAICVAHHKDDSVETVLMNLIRGTGLHGLTGIANRNGHIIRPLLCVFRQEIEQTLALAHQKYVTDSTNLEDDVVRNKIRLNLLPLIRGMNPSVSESIAHTAQRIEQAALVFDAAMAESVKRVILSPTINSLTLPVNGVEISISQLTAEVSPEYTLYYILKTYGFTPSQIEQLAENLQTTATGKTISSATHQLLVNRNSLIVEPISSKTYTPIKIPEEGIYVCNNEVKLKFEQMDIAQSTISRDPLCACIDESKVAFPFTVRTVQQGDRFVPFGMKGSKLVSDFLTDCKMSLFDKRKQLVITDATGCIIWLAGLRISNKCRIGKSTQRIIKITFIEHPHN